ncbi:MAG: AAA family ATPase, partial [Bacteroidales bacterium]|nr:AAA family ATPase [Bacteroidales bacterium]
MNTVRKLPVGIQDFEKLRKENCLYVDKTQYVYQLAQTVSPYFLARPRRFGKSLFLSTLKAYFEGKKELFEGLKIAGLEKEWTEYPVIYLDFNVGLLTSATNVAERLSVKIKELENLWGKKTDTGDLASRFEAVIESAYEQTGKKAVVLIDEYDKPLISTMEDETANNEI